jgi:hypothetical protein
MALTTAAMRLRGRLSSGEWWSAPAGNRFVGWCAGAAFAPFGILALRIAVIRPRVYLAGDLAIMDVTVRRALHWQGALGPYDRFHWHHPGPILVYMFAFADRIVGASNGAAAQMIVAALVAAVCLGGIVLALAWGQKLSRTTVVLAVATTLAFALLLAVAGTARLAGRLGARHWRWVHHLSGAVLILVWVHGVLAGTDTAALRGCYVGSAGLLVALAVTRVLARVPEAA